MSIPLVAILCLAFIVTNVWTVYVARRKVAAARMLVPDVDFRGPGPTRLQVSVVGAGDYVSLGESSEPMGGEEGPSATPSIITNEVELTTPEGLHFKIPTGRRLKVLSLSGARRQVLEMTTTTDSMRQRMTFEVRPHTRFLIEGRLTASLVQLHPDAAYRQSGESDVTLEPLAVEGYLVTDGASLPLPKTHGIWVILIATLFGGSIVGGIVGSIFDGYATVVSVGVVFTLVQIISTRMTDATYPAHPT